MVIRIHLAMHILSTAYFFPLLLNSSHPKPPKHNPQQTP